MHRDPAYRSRPRDFKIVTAIACAAPFAFRGERQGTMRRVLAFLALCLLVGCGFAGCGGSDSPAEQRQASDREQIEAVAERFAAAVAAKDAKAFCATLAPIDVERLGEGRSDGGKRCLVVWGEGRNPLFLAKNPDLALEEITEMKSTTATAELANGGELAFIKEGGGWYIHLAPAKE